MKRTIVAVLLLVLLLLTAAALAGPTNFTASWWTVDGGGGRSSGGNYALSGTVGQFDAHTASTGGDYAVRSGFWQAVAIGEEDALFLPFVLSQ
jgi:hypothetical protein